MDQNTNRRKAFRLQDEILLKVEKLKAADPELMESEYLQRRTRFGVLTHLKYGTEKNLPTMRTIERKYPEVAQYLQFLERQIQAISAHNSLHDSAALDLGDKQWVELSANGMRFSTTDTFTVGDYLQIMMVLFPDELRIMLVATVIRSETLNDGLQEVSVSFTHLHVEDEEALIKHLHKRQIESLRKSKDA